MKKITIILILSLFSVLLSGQSVSTGTGFFITDSGHIITCAHVIEGASRIVIKIDNREYVAEVLSMEERIDLALIKINYRNPFHFRIANFNDVNLGDRINVLGFPLSSILGSDIKLTDGIVSSKSGLESDQTRFQISAPIQPGNSGGPIFLSDFSVIGIASEKLSDAYSIDRFGVIPQNVNFGVKSIHINNLLYSVRLGSGNVKQMNDAVVATVQVIAHEPENQITITNQTGYTAFYLYVSPSSSTEWGNDLLGRDVLLSGSSWKYRLPNNHRVGTLYDIRLTDLDGDTYSKFQIPIASNQNIVFNIADIDLGNLQPTQTQPLPNTSGTPSVRIFNRTGYHVWYAYVSPSSSSEWGRDVLGDDVLMNGENVTVRLSRPLDPQHKYDIRLVDSDGDTYTKMGVDIRGNLDLDFTILDIDL
jgi:hypothetical protein